MATFSRADDYSFKYGMGIIDEELTGEVKIFNLRHEQHTFAMIHTAQELGCFVDQGRDSGRRSSGFVDYEIGVKPGPEVGVYGKAFWGVLAMSGPDTLLGGPFQFVSDFGVGIRDPLSSISVGYKHISSAGFYSPNKGRDFINLELGISF